MTESNASRKDERRSNGEWAKREYRTVPGDNPDTAQVSPEYWSQFCEATRVAVLHSVKPDIQKLRLADFNIVGGNWVDAHLRDCDDCNRIIRRELRATSM
jgi:hypothetical protein